jgi:hypothetical protein
LHGNTTAVVLERAPETPRALNVTSGGFVKARYFLRLPKGIEAGEAVLAVPEWKAQPVIFVVRDYPDAVALSQQVIVFSPPFTRTA